METEEQWREEGLFYTVPELILWHTALSCAVLDHPDPYICPGRKDSVILPFLNPHCSWLQQQEDNMAAEGVRSPTLDQPPSYMEVLENKSL